MIKNKTIIITGTHHTPAIELIHILQSDTSVNWKIVYIGHQYSTESHIIHTIIPKLKVEFINLECGKFDRKNLDKTIYSIPKIISAFFTSIKLISSIKPNIVVSFGGYVSVPVIMAAYFKKIPSITHEQTLTISLSTKINSFFATKMAVSFPYKNAVYTGNLIRHEIFNTTTGKFKHLKKPIIYITGGNQGSLFLNQLAYKLTPRLSSKFSIIHQTGKNADLNIQENLLKSYPDYYPYEFIEIEDIGWVLNKSDVIISRSGANICQELDILDKNSILIPLPYTQQNEQEKNALWLNKLHPNHVTIIPQNIADVDHVINSIKLNRIKPYHKPLPTIHPLFKLIHEISS